ncbi:unnamed protein product [Closterium sp. NIES-65]|nr:unnamed protein product [Closterium sp. NIES-65]
MNTLLSSRSSDSIPVPTEPSHAKAHKRIIGTRFIVDGFRHAGPWSRCYLLTHFHADHYCGLSPSWRAGVIFCSPVTARLLSEVLGIPPAWVRALPLRAPVAVDGARVVLRDAHHCPGAVMLLFRIPPAGGDVGGSTAEERGRQGGRGQGKFLAEGRRKSKDSAKGEMGGGERMEGDPRGGKGEGEGGSEEQGERGEVKWRRVVHTGDFRLSPCMLGDPVMQAMVGADAVYLDTTYCHPRHVFPPQSDAVQYVAQMVRRVLGEGGERGRGSEVRGREDGGGGEGLGGGLDGGEEEGEEVGVGVEGGDGMEGGGGEGDRGGKKHGENEAEGEAEGVRQRGCGEVSGISRAAEAADAADTVEGCTGKAAGTEQGVDSMDVAQGRGVRAATAAAASVAAASAEEQQRKPHSNDRVLILVSTYVIGKEKLLLSTASHCHTRIVVDPAKLNTLRSLDLTPAELAVFTTDPAASPVHVVRWGVLGDVWPFFRPNWRNMERLGRERGCGRVVGVVPTGWMYEMKREGFPVRRKSVVVGGEERGVSVEAEEGAVGVGGEEAGLDMGEVGVGMGTGKETGGMEALEKGVSMSSSGMVDGRDMGMSDGGKSMREDRSSRGMRMDLEIHLVPYSEHCSFSELRSFLSFLRPHRIIPTVNTGETARPGTNQLHHLRGLVDESACKQRFLAGFGRRREGRGGVVVGGESEGEVERGGGGVGGGEERGGGGEGLGGCMVESGWEERGEEKIEGEGEEGGEMREEKKGQAEGLFSLERGAGDVCGEGKAERMEEREGGGEVCGGKGGGCVEELDQAGPADVATLHDDVAVSDGLLPAAKRRRLEPCGAGSDSNGDVTTCTSTRSGTKTGTRPGESTTPCAPAPSLTPGKTPITGLSVRPDTRPGATPGSQAKQSTRMRGSRGGGGGGGGGARSRSRTEAGRKSVGKQQRGGGAAVARVGGMQRSIKHFFGSSSAAAPSLPCSVDTVGLERAAEECSAVQMVTSTPPAATQPLTTAQVNGSSDHPPSPVRPAAPARLRAEGCSAVQRMVAVGLPGLTAAVAVRLLKAHGGDVGRAMDAFLMHVEGAGGGAGSRGEGGAGGGAGVGVGRGEGEVGEGGEEVGGAREREAREGEGRAGEGEGKRGEGEGKGGEGEGGTGEGGEGERGAREGGEDDRKCLEEERGGAEGVGEKALAGWEEGAAAPYMHLAVAFDAVERESGRIKSSDILTNTFRSLLALSPNDLLPAVYLCTNRIAPDFVNADLNVGGGTVAGAVCEATGMKRQQLRLMYTRMGDLGDVAHACRSSQRLLRAPQPLTIHRLFHALRALR